MESLPELDADIRSGATRRAAARPQGGRCESAVDRRRAARPRRADWLRAPVLAALFAAIGIVAVHWNTAASIVAIWMRSETFAHGFLVVPLALWLVYRQRETLARDGGGALVAGLGRRAGGGVPLARHDRRSRAGRDAIRAGVHGPGGHRHRGRPTRVARPDLPARVPAVRNTRWRDLRADAHRLDRRLHRRRAARLRCAGLSRGEPIRHSVRNVVGGRGVQRHPLHHCIGDGRDDLCGDRVSKLAPARAVRGRVDRHADRRQLVARLHDRHARTFVEQPDRGRRRSPDLWLVVLRARHAAPLLGRLILAGSTGTGCGAGVEALSRPPARARPQQQVVRGGARVHRRRRHLRPARCVYGPATGTCVRRSPPR